jgi:tetratricopeptide (TPR) repeat protein
MVMRNVRPAYLAFSFLLAVSCCAAQSTPKSSAAELAQRQTAITLEQKGNPQEAEKAWRAIIKTNPRNAEAYAHLGLLAARRESYEQAIPLYRKALSLNPAVPGLRMDLGLALFKGGNPKEAISEFTVLLNAPKVSPAEAYRLRVLIGMAHYGQGEFSDAVPYLKEAAAADPKNLQLRLLLAHSCLWTKQDQCVLDTYKEILTIDPDSAEADIMAGEALDEMRDSFGAIQQFRAAVKANPKVPGVHFGLGYLLWTQRHYPEAGSEFQAELANDPNHAKAMTYLADVNLQLGHPEGVLPLLEKAIRIDPGIEQAHLDLGILFAEAGRKEDAVRELNIAAKEAPGDVNVHWRLGRLYRSMGRKDEAKVEFEKASQAAKASDQAIFDKINNEHPRPPQAQPPAPESPEK